MPPVEKTAALKRLKNWFQKEKRVFPWREANITPYGVWVSEIMLQQTRAEVVIPYFLRWMNQFPTIERLAQAEEGAVVKAWEGLGYYSRARRLWQGARFLIENYQGHLPTKYEDLLEIPGFGPYTAGAVLSFAFHQKAAAVDGNVSRVLARFFAIEDEIDKGPVQKALREHVLDLLPKEEPWVIMEALIELGAVVCNKKPNCLLCPLKPSCLAYKKNLAGVLPRKKKGQPVTILERDVALLIYDNEILVGQVKKGKVMEGLYEFPYFDRNDIAIEHRLKSLSDSSIHCTAVFDEVEHTFTRFRARLYPSVWRLEKKSLLEGYEWHPINDLRKLPFSSGHRRIMEAVFCKP